MSFLGDWAGTLSWQWKELTLGCSPGASPSPPYTQPWPGLGQKRSPDSGTETRGCRECQSPDGLCPLSASCRPVTAPALSCTARSRLACSSGLASNVPHRQSSGLGCPLHCPCASGSPVLPSPQSLLQPWPLKLLFLKVLRALKSNLLTLQQPQPPASAGTGGGIAMGFSKQDYSGIRCCTGRDRHFQWGVSSPALSLSPPLLKFRQKLE